MDFVIDFSTAGTAIESTALLSFILLVLGIVLAAGSWLARISFLERNAAADRKQANRDRKADQKRANQDRKAARKEAILARQEANRDRKEANRDRKALTQSLNQLILIGKENLGVSKETLDTSKKILDVTTQNLDATNQVLSYMSGMESDIKTIKLYVADDGTKADASVEAGGGTALARASTLCLTSLGRMVTEEISGSDWAQQEAEGLVAQVEELTPYKIQHFCFKYVKEAPLTPEMCTLVEERAFVHGLRKKDVKRVLAIELRDVFLAKLGHPVVGQSRSPGAATSALGRAGDADTSGRDPVAA